ncbi:DEP domain-containing protein 4 [Gadus macrocephalus]|uniref:DEP domain-containing protein 4 n=1 Tax=Gadus macrocephalus TaxID=80720 RepID=UPI0028CB6FF8|nr:DEP domain-containing protein 4 [Gadus macrocephalus]
MDGAFPHSLQRFSQQFSTEEEASRMAVDLTPRFRRLNSQTRSFRENIQIGLSGPFRATHLWRNIIQALQAQVEVRSRRKHLRVHADCFTGSDAVDAVLSYLMQNVVFCASEVSRLKAARLCQALMEAKVFEPVGTKLFRRDKDTAFEDGSCSLYRFLECKSLSSSLSKDCDSENVTPGELESKKKKASRQHELRTFSNPLAVGPSERGVERVLRRINLQPSLALALDHRAPSSSSFLSKAALEALWRQQTLLQLLQVVELPMLECILSSPPRARGAQACPRPPGSGHQDLVISNTCLERELHQMLHLPRLDDWLLAAADCLELLPDRLIVAVGGQLAAAAGEGPGAAAGPKRLLFNVIAKHYGGQETGPLLAGRYSDVHVAIHGLLERGEEAAALKASQLCLRLLDASGRDQLRRLLAFMAQAAAPDACRLHRQIPNRMLVSRTFQKAVVRSCELSPAQSQALLLFLMDQHTRLFKTPSCVIEAVRKTLRDMQKGKDPDSIGTFTFCQQVSPQQYEDQREASTLQSLKRLLSDVVLSDRLPAKERSRLVKEFQKHHPVVFLQHFSGTY